MPIQDLESLVKKQDEEIKNLKKLISVLKHQVDYLMTMTNRIKGDIQDVKSTIQNLKR